MTVNKIDVSDFNLNAIFCCEVDGYSYSLTNGTNWPERIIYDYEVEYYTQSEGGNIIDGNYIPFETGSVSFKKPGQVIKGVPPYKAYTVCIDILGNKRKLNKAYHPWGSSYNAQPRYDNEILNIIPDKIPAAACENIGKIMKDIYYDYNFEDTLMMKSNLYLLINELYKCSLQKNLTLLKYNSSIKKALQYINNNFTKNIDMNYLSAYSGLSKSYFYKVFKDCVGVTPNQFILRLRLKKAKYLLAITDMSISDIGYECGFLDNAYFSYVFKREEGQTPKEFRNLT